MAKPTEIQHPLLRLPGSSQGKRISDGLVPQLNAELIDNRSLADLLDHIHQYARQVVFPEHKIDEAGAAYEELSNWLPFFENSLPFRLTRFGKTDFDRLEGDLAAILDTITGNPDPGPLALLLDFCVFELIAPIDQLQKVVGEFDFALAPWLKTAIQGSLSSPLARFIQLSNTAGIYFCLEKPRFEDFTNEPWRIPVEEIYSWDKSITALPGGREGALLWLKDELAGPMFEMLRALRQMAGEAANHLQASIEVLQGRHEPHLGLLFAFLRLFRPFQGDLNRLTRKHLDYFYQQVLQIKPKGLVRDKAHLIFQVAKHLDSHRVEEGTIFKDGKDANNLDVLFGLDEAVVIDKAQVVDLKTLYLNPAKGCLDTQRMAGQPRSIIEGLYIAPIANSADGKGIPFKEDQSKNWPTLGAKFGKYVAPGKDAPETFPLGRIGFVLASPILLLNEGTRDVTITIECDVGGNPDAFTDCFQTNAGKMSENELYNIDEQTIVGIENLFSPKALAFLQEKLDAASEFLVEDVRTLVGGGVFNASEAELLQDLSDEDSEGRHILRELPFASLKRRFDLLRLHQDPYAIGFDLKNFFETQDPVSCEPLLKESLRKYIIPLLNQEAESANWFTLQFSGEKGWFTAKGLPAFRPQFDTVKKLGILRFDVRLETGEPKVTFYDEKAIGETFAVTNPFPMVKIELNPKIQLACQSDCGPNPCCLGVSENSGNTPSALYHFLRHLKINSVNIEVHVCGMKNLIVQNQESLQDVNKPVLPFGARPRVGAEFYVGNKELFGKNWKTFWLYAEWKDKPEDLGKWYSDYEIKDFQGNATVIDDHSFQFDSAILDDHQWKGRPNANPHEPREIFESDYGGNPGDDPCDRNVPRAVKGPAYYKEFQRGEFDQIQYVPKSLRSGDLGALTVNTEADFFRITLRGIDFQHDHFPFVLARKLFELSGAIGAQAINSIKLILADAVIYRNAIETEIGDIRTKIDAMLTIIDTTIDTTLDTLNLIGLPAALQNVKKLLDNIIHDIDLALAALPPTPTLPPGPPSLATFTAALNALISAVTTLNGTLTALLTAARTDANTAVSDLTDLNAPVATLIAGLRTASAELRHIIGDINHVLVKQGIPVSPTNAANANTCGVMQLLNLLKDGLGNITTLLNPATGALPNEPYTPTLKSIEIDYYATADTKDIDLIHLYPFPNSSKAEYLELGATLLPTFTHEGTLFIGLDSIRVGANLQLLFQFAEATADSESKRAEINWHYLTGNRWQPLRRGFEVVSDDTQRMTRSGIVKIALPRDITNVGNTLMPPTKDGDHLYWLKVSAPDSTETVAELFGVHAQAAAVTYQPLPGNDAKRVAKALAPTSIGKTLEPNFSIKKVEQPYESFGGRLAEEDGHIYTRVSEQLRHKGRSVDIFDVEHLVLEAFPEIYKCKCVSHTMGLSAHEYRRDLEVAPGFITVAVVPDLGKLKAGEVLEPKAPVTMLTDIKAFLHERMSPFARIRVLNPRYEKIRVEVKVRLTRGRDESYCTAQLKTDLMHFLAPWYLGDSDKMSFGQHVVYSDVVSFIENLDYIEFVADLRLIDSENVERKEIVPLTARSILTGGQVCIDLDREDCGEPSPPPPGREKPALTLPAPGSFPCGTGRPFGLVIRKALNPQ